MGKSSLLIGFKTIRQHGRNLGLARKTLAAEVRWPEKLWLHPWKDKLTPTTTLMQITNDNSGVMKAQITDCGVGGGSRITWHEAETMKHKS